MGIWMKVFIFFVVGIAIIFIYSQDCVSQHTVKNKETVLIKTFEPKRAFEFIKQNKRNPDFVVLDIRTSREFQDGHIAGAVNIDFYSPTFAEDLERLDKSKTYFIYCRTGRRSADAIAIMTQKGFKNIYRTPGDIVAWRAAGLPLVKGAKSS
jgi:rhodanese-related sulfurtransferase